MPKICALLMTLLVAATALAQSPNGPPASPTVAESILHNYEVIPNIVYLTANNTDLRLDIYRRKTDAPTPTVIFIHGGGWVSGTKEAASLNAVPFMEMGFSVVNVEYRLAHNSLAPAAVEDCRCALRWVVRNAEKYHFDPRRIITSGDSAGGHLALTTAMMTSAAGFDGECPAEHWDSSERSEPKVAAVVNWYGITDVADELEGPNAKGYAVEWFGSLPNRRQLAQRLSPLAHVTAGGPPVISIHGDQDTVVPYSGAARLHDALKKAGVKNQLLTIPGGGHGGFSQEQLSAGSAAIREFLRSQNLLPAQTAANGKD
jgi:acetyl esterase/lipase